MFQVHVSPTERLEVPFDPGHPDVLVHYDHPMMFVTEWGGSPVLVTMIDECGPRRSLWMAVGLSNDRRRALFADELSLYDAYKDKPSRRVALIWSEPGSHTRADFSHHIWVDAHELSDAWVPQPGVYLSPEVSA